MAIATNEKDTHNFLFFLEFNHIYSLFHLLGECILASAMKQTYHFIAFNSRCAFKHKHKQKYIVITSGIIVNENNVYCMTKERKRSVQK